MFCFSKLSFEIRQNPSVDLFDDLVKPIRGISLKEVRVDRILEGVVGVQEYKNSVNPGPQFKDIFPNCVTQV